MLIDILSIGLTLWLLAANAEATEPESAFQQAVAHLQKGDHERAEKEGIAMTASEDPATRAHGLYVVGAVQDAREDDQEALEQFTSALEILDAIEDETDALIALRRSVYVHLGPLLRVSGRLRESLEAYRLTLAMFEEGDPRALPTQVNLAILLERTGDIEQASQVYENARSTLGAQERPDLVTMAHVVAGLSRIALHNGDLEGAEAMTVQSLDAMRAANAGPMSIAMRLNDLGKIHRQAGDYIAAREALEESRDLIEASLGPDHALLARAMSNLGALLTDQGDLEAALAMHLEALSRTAARLGPDNVELAFILGNAASTAQNLGRHDQALSLQIRALDLRERNLGPDDPNIAVNLHNLATLHIAMGDLGSAQGTHQRSLEMRERIFGPDHPETARGLRGMAYIESNIDGGDKELAIAYNRRALAIDVAVFGDEHPVVVTDLNNLAFSLDDKTGRDETRSLVRNAAEIQTRHVQRVLPSLSEREALGMVREHRYAVDNMISEWNGEGDASTVWHQWLRWQGAVARASAARRAMALDSPETAALAASLRQARLELARVARQPRDAENGADALRDLVESVDALEHDIAASSPNLQKEFEARGADPEGVCDVMPADLTVVDFVQFMKVDKPWLAAFATTNDCAIRRVDLGPSAQIEVLVSAHRDVLADSLMGTGRIDARGERLREAIWDPLEVETSRVILVPDGVLAPVSFAALPLDDGYLIEAFSLSYLESATDLVRWPTPPDEPRSALIVGDVDYGDPAPSESPCIDRTFDRLPGAALETEQVSGALPRRLHQTRFDGRSASEREVTAAMPDREMIHFATHGYLADADCQSELRRSGAGFDAMVLSGLVLAGANEAAEDPKWDGLLTAAEVSALDLRGVDLVVLSACNTGLGEVHNGEGVLGLRRGFATAGVRALVMSLWAVDDQATAELMSHFYARKRRKLGRAEALRQAQLAMISESRNQLGHGSPTTWAAFVVAGDWR